VAGRQGRSSTLPRPCGLSVCGASIPLEHASECRSFGHPGGGPLCAWRGRRPRAWRACCGHRSQSRRPNAFFHRFFGSSNFTAAGSNASGSTLPGPLKGRLVLLMIGISDDLKELGIAVDATTVLRRTPALTGDTTRIATVVIGRLEAFMHDHASLRRVEQPELVKVVVEPAHRILDGDVQVPEGVPLGHLDAAPDERSVPDRTTRNWCTSFGRGVARFLGIARRSATGPRLLGLRLGHCQGGNHDVTRSLEGHAPSADAPAPSAHARGPTWPGASARSRRPNASGLRTTAPYPH
jgi:hypothetical protein